MSVMARINLVSSIMRLTAGLPFLILPALTTSAAPSSDPIGASHRVSISPMASLVLPRSSRAVIVKSMGDAWAGYIEFEDHSLISYTSGLVQPEIRAETRKAFRWLKREKIAAGDLTYGIQKGKGPLIFKATSGRTSFISTIPAERAIEPLLQILRTLGLQCLDCERARVESEGEEAR